jgi:hypothetical protein
MPCNLLRLIQKTRRNETKQRPFLLLWVPRKDVSFVEGERTKNVLHCASGGKQMCPEHRSLMRPDFEDVLTE